jgi:hypothetical protein
MLADEVLDAIRPLSSFNQELPTRDKLFPLLAKVSSPRCSQQLKSAKQQIWHRSQLRNPPKSVRWQQTMVSHSPASYPNGTRRLPQQEPDQKEEKNEKEDEEDDEIKVAADVGVRPGPPDPLVSLIGPILCRRTKGGEEREVDVTHLAQDFRSHGNLDTMAARRLSPPTIQFTNFKDLYQVIDQVSQASGDFLIVQSKYSTI